MRLFEPEEEGEEEQVEDGEPFEGQIFKSIQQGLISAIKEGRLTEFLPQIAVFVAGFRAAQTQKLNILDSFLMGGVGLIGLSLAKTDGLASQAAGLGILGGLGVLNVAPLGLKEFVENLDPSSIYPIKPDEQCQPGYDKIFDPMHGIWACRRKQA